MSMIVHVAQIIPRKVEPPGPYLRDADGNYYVLDQDGNKVIINLS